MSRTPRVILKVADMARAIKFYQQLGFPLESVALPAGLAQVVGPGDTPLLLAAPTADLTGLDAPQARPAAVVYLRRPDLAELAGRLEKAGIAFQGPEEPYPGWRQILVTDPDGYVLTFWEYPPLSDEEILRIYREGPARLRAAVDALGPANLDRPRAPNKWTYRQIVHHIVDADMGTFQVLSLALALPGRTITTNVWDPDDWIEALRCVERPVEPALNLLEAARMWVLDVVEHLPDALDRTVKWPSGHEAQVRVLLRQVGGHGLHHTLQLEEGVRRLRAGDQSKP